MLYKITHTHLITTPAPCLEQIRVENINFILYIVANSFKVKKNVANFFFNRKCNLDATCIVIFVTL